MYGEKEFQEMAREVLNYFVLLLIKGFLYFLLLNIISMEML